MPVDATQWVWIDDATREYGKSRATLDAWVSAGKVRYDKPASEGGRKTYLLRADVEREVAKSPGSRLRPPTGAVDNGDDEGSQAV